MYSNFVDSLTLQKNLVLYKKVHEEPMLEWNPSE